MAKDLDFSDLGAEEVKPLDFSDLGGQAVDEVSEDVPRDPMSMAQSALRGAEQYGSAGFYDELAGGLSGAGALVGIKGLGGRLEDIEFDPSVKMAEEYRRVRDLERSQAEKAAKDNPVAYHGSGVATSIGTALAAAPLSLGSKLIAPFGATPQGASLAQKVLTTAGNAVPMAAIGSAGMSEADTLGGVARDTREGALLGAGIGAAGQAIGSGVKGIGKAISKTEVAQDMIKNFKDAWAGLDVRTPEALVAARDELKSLANTADQSIKKANNKLFGKKTEILKNLEDSGITVDAKDVLKDFANKVGSTNALRSEESEIINRVLEAEFRKGGTRTPMELENLLKEFQNLKGSVQTPTGYKAASDAEAAIKAIQNNLDPEIQKINNKLFQTIEAGETLTGKNPMDYLTGKKELGLENTLANKLENIDNYKVASDFGDIVSTGLETGKGTKISPLSELVPAAAEAVQKAKPVAERMSRILRTQDDSPIAGNDFLGKLVSSVMPPARKSSAALGSVAKQNVDFLTDGAKKLSNASPEVIQQIASKIATKSAEGAAYAKMLIDASAKNSQSKNALIFGLMQRKDFRELFQETNDTEKKK
jgi:hypothetical protein